MYYTRRFVTAWFNNSNNNNNNETSYYKNKKKIRIGNRILFHEKRHNVGKVIKETFCVWMQVKKENIVSLEISDFQ